MNKKGVQGPVTIQMFLYVLVTLFVVIFLGIYLYAFNLINDNLGIDVEVGNVNLQNVTADTFGQINSAFTTNADILGIVILLIMSVAMMLNGFFLGRDNSKLWIVGDIFIIVFVFILAVYVAQIYDTFLTGIASIPALESVYIDDLSKSSKFILNLPIYVATIGALIMIISYSQLNSKESGGANVLGF